MCFFFFLRTLTHKHTHTHMQRYIYTHTHTHIHTHTRTHTHTGMFKGCVDGKARGCKNTHTYTHTHIHALTHPSCRRESNLIIWKPTMCMYIYTHMPIGARGIWARFTSERVHLLGGGSPVVCHQLQVTDTPVCSLLFGVCCLNAGKNAYKMSTKRRQHSCLVCNSAGIFLEQVDFRNTTVTPF
jgi:hypothetical protein